MLTEREDLLVLRQNYLYDIRKYREEGRTTEYMKPEWSHLKNYIILMES